MKPLVFTSTSAVVNPTLANWSWNFFVGLINSVNTARRPVPCVDTDLIPD